MYLGGYGDPDDFYRVNGYSWDISTEQYWSPMRKGAECEATGDECPICSLKRVGIAQNQETEEFKYVNSAKDVGQAIIENTKFKDFQVWVVSQCGGFPHGIDNSYDPIWYLFHSMETYYQAMWINCHNYDEIKGDELYDYIPNAFEPYCLEDDKNECVAINLDDPLYFEGVLAKRPWSFIHNEQINIKKLYHLPNWNVIYDLNDDDFYIKSRLRQKCGSNLNSEWFMFPADDIDGLIDQEMVGSFGDMSLRNKVLNIEVEYIKITCIFFVMLGFMIVLCKMYFSQRNNDEIYEISKSKYGSV